MSPSMLGCRRARLPNRGRGRLASSCAGFAATRRRKLRRPAQRQQTSCAGERKGPRAGSVARPAQPEKNRPDEALSRPLGARSPPPPHRRRVRPDVRRHLRVGRRAGDRCNIVCFGSQPFMAAVAMPAPGHGPGRLRRRGAWLRPRRPPLSGPMRCGAVARCSRRCA
jgi:hypothetical protein